jgi:3-(3-hydroxy-phenyl)propionate hydroxylase
MVEMPNRKDPTLDAGWVRGPISDEGIIGKMVPQPQVANAQGKLCLLDDVLGVGFALIGDGFDPAECLSAEEKADWDRLGARYLVLRSSKDKGRGSNDIIDLDGSLLQWMRDLGVRAIALRPDRFVAAADVHGLAVPDC